jgi:hypothetical protein
MQQAQTAIDSARAAGADQYARDEFAAAVDALKRSRDAVADHDYRLALNDALDSRERAQTATEEAADAKASARTDAERLILSTATALDAAGAKLKAAQAARVPGRTLADPGRVISDADRSVQEARAAFQRGDYLAVPVTLKGLTERLSAAAQAIDAATGRLAVRRHR